jgi:hypothetical protein
LNYIDLVDNLIAEYSDSFNSRSSASLPANENSSKILSKAAIEELGALLSLRLKLYTIFRPVGTDELYELLQASFDASETSLRTTGEFYESLSGRTLSSSLANPALHQRALTMIDEASAHILDGQTKMLAALDEIDRLTAWSEVELDLIRGRGIRTDREWLPRKWSGRSTEYTSFETEMFTVEAPWVLEWDIRGTSNGDFLKRFFEPGTVAAVVIWIYESNTFPHAPVDWVTVYETSESGSKTINSDGRFYVSIEGVGEWIVQVRQSQ